MLQIRLKSNLIVEVFVLVYVIADSYASRFTCVYLQNETGFDGRIIKQGFLLKKVCTFTHIQNVYIMWRYVYCSVFPICYLIE